MNPILLAPLILIGLAVLIFVAMFLRVFNLWAQAALSGAHVGFWEIIGMRLRRSNAQAIVFAHIRQTRAGLDLTPRQLESHHLAGGNVDRVVEALIVAKNAGLEIPFDEAAAIDLAGHSIVPHEFGGAAYDLGSPR